MAGLWDDSAVSVALNPCREIMTPSKPLLLVLNPLSQAHREAIAARHELIYAPDPLQRSAAIAQHASAIEVVLTIGSIGLTAAEIDAMPRLSLICALGAGYENIAVAHAKARGIAVGSGAGTNDGCVADHAMALLLAAVRAVPQFDRACRAGVWRTELPTRPNVSGKRLGLLGYGAIGRKIARRAEAFDMPIGYCTLTQRPDVEHRWFDTPVALAAWCDFLVVAIPGGAATRHLVNADVLAALGPQGYLVNIARGSVVDTAALAEALREGRVGGAGLDVYESEPGPPAELLEFGEVVLTPHVAGTSPEAVQATIARFIENSTLHFSGKPIASPV
jgi:lactate dehydrogenase-like 2-hydroxyacid dehydrogenase